MWSLHRYLGGAVWLLSHLVVVAAVKFSLALVGMDRSFMGLIVGTSL